MEVGHDDPFEQEREQRRRIAALHEASATAARRAHELLTDLVSEREQRERLERDLARARTRIAELEGDDGVPASDPVPDPVGIDQQPEPVLKPADEPVVMPGPSANPEPDQPTVVESLETAPRSGVPDGPRWNARAQRDLTAALTTASDWQIGLRDAIRVLGSHGNWDVVAVWVPHARQAVLRCTTIWTSRQDLREFETESAQRHLPVAGTQLGRSLFAAGVTVLTDMADADDPRLRAAGARGMRSGLLVPVREGRSTVAALELLSEADQPPDEELAISAEAVAVQLAHFRRLLRMAGAPRWRLGRF